MQKTLFEIMTSKRDRSDEENFLKKYLYRTSDANRLQALAIGLCVQKTYHNPEGRCVETLKNSNQKCETKPVKEFLKMRKYPCALCFRSISIHNDELLYAPLPPEKKPKQEPQKQQQQQSLSSRPQPTQPQPTQPQPTPSQPQQAAATAPPRIEQQQNDYHRIFQKSNNLLQSTLKKYRETSWKPFIEPTIRKLHLHDKLITGDDVNTLEILHPGSDYNSSRFF